ncbi:MFS transporter [Variovorax sp. Sphag1AA]|uniref:MFS transporter n=1 Tax=Variovorax sp. Sphag1AA TaxID=2587027 RepID=UPI0016104DC5|nr:MFS transporter [Variovorax sp. Sphag1AA]MBB3181176.1 DHA2 family multidrug resistance protein-like MFS transporter [Variovorax sp. Sphag1AA]
MNPSTTQLPRAAAVAAVLAAMVLVVLDAGIANVALPTIARSLQVTPGMSVWVITAYQTALVMGLLPCAALGESQGHRGVFAIGVAVFTAASALCALSPSLPWLVAARFLQGLGGAAVMSLGVALLRSIVPRQQLGAAIGWNALAVALSSAAGPTIGALILSHASWPWLFLLNVPLGAAVLLAARALPALKGTGRWLDLISVALNAGALAALVIGAELLIEKPAVAVLLLGAAALGLTMLVRREMPKAVPLVPLDLLRSPSLRVSVIASVSCFSGTTLGLMALPFYLQHSFELDALTTGLHMTPWPLTVALVAPLAGRLADRMPTSWLCVTGAGILAVALGAASLWPFQGRPQALVLITVVCGIGFGLFQVPNNRNMFLSAPDERSGAAGGMQGTARLAGQTAGGIVMSLLFTVASADTAPRIALGIAAVLTFAAGFVSMARTASALNRAVPPRSEARGPATTRSRSLDRAARS